MIGAKALRIIFDKVDGFISVYDGHRYLVLFRPEKYDVIYNRIRYLVSQKSIITYGFSYNYAKIKIDSNDSLPLEKAFTLHNVVILIKSIFNKDQNHYYYTIFLEKCLYQLGENLFDSIIMLRFGEKKEGKRKNLWCNKTNQYLRC